MEIKTRVIGGGSSSTNTLPWMVLIGSSISTLPHHLHSASTSLSLIVLVKRLYGHCKSDKSKKCLAARVYFADANFKRLAITGTFRFLLLFHFSSMYASNSSFSFSAGTSTRSFLSDFTP